MLSFEDELVVCDRLIRVQWRYEPFRYPGNWQVYRARC